MTLYAIIYS